MAYSRDIELGDECPTPLSRLTELAKEDPARRFYSIAHFLTPRALYEAFKGLRKDASAGVDGVTYQDYQKELGRNLQDLMEKVKSGQYRAQPLRRVYIPKEDGKQRPISIPALEDKILQAATVRLLNAVYEVDFLDCSYGSRPGRDAHQALDEIDRILFREPITYVLELDLKSYFDSIVRTKLVEMIERRVSDGSILRLIGKWINVGAVDEGRLLKAEDGVGQGQVVTPRTQKRTSSLSARFRDGARRASLIIDTRSIILMSHGAIHAGAESAKAERRLSLAGASDEHGGSCRLALARGGDITTSCIPLPQNRRKTETTCCDWRTCAAHYLQDSRRRDPRASRIYRDSRSDIERGCDARHHAVRGTCPKTCLGGVPRVIFVLNTPSIVCSPPNSSKFTSSWFPTVRG
jgi:hypothetical protein